MCGIKNGAKMEIRRRTGGTRKGAFKKEKTISYEYNSFFGTRMGKEWREEIWKEVAEMRQTRRI